jgi:hypothetical protein
MKHKRRNREEIIRARLIGCPFSDEQEFIPRELDALAVYRTGRLATSSLSCAKTDSVASSPRRI